MSPDERRKMEYLDDETLHRFVQCRDNLSTRQMVRVVSELLALRKQPNVIGVACKDCQSETFRVAMLEHMEAADKLRAVIADLDEGCRQALVHIEFDELSHGRTFAAGNAIRSALAVTSCPHHKLHLVGYGPLIHSGGPPDKNCQWTYQCLDCLKYLKSDAPRDTK